tara:strand:+ start:1249 stop:1785 length:537 start_codon:yes stop_codon:yes gene_type:complete
MAETPIVSESLQQQFRATFPSQISSGRDLHVSDTIIPIVDFSSQAGSGSTLNESLNNAVDFSTTDTGIVHSTSATVVNTTGFFKITGFSVSQSYVPPAASAHFTIDDGSTTKVVFTPSIQSDTGDGYGVSTGFNFVCYLTAGMTLTLVVATYSWARAHSRQIADVNGNATVPLNFVAS